MTKFNLNKKSTMRELLPKMTQKTKSDCEDALRLYVMFVNGAAAIHMSSGNYGEAVMLYRNVLNKMKAFEILTPDSFQVNKIESSLIFIEAIRRRCGRTKMAYPLMTFSFCLIQIALMIIVSLNLRRTSP